MPMRSGESNRQDRDAAPRDERALGRPNGPPRPPPPVQPPGKTVRPGPQELPAPKPEPPTPERKATSSKKRTILIAASWLLALLLAFTLTLLFLKSNGGCGAGGAGPYAGGPGGGEGPPGTAETAAGQGKPVAAEGDQAEGETSEYEQEEQYAAPADSPQLTQTDEAPFVVVVESRSTGEAEDSGGHIGRIGGGGGGGSGSGGRPLGTGDVSFRLYWKPPVHDVDLHVIDPSGHHLWYRAMGCSCNGILDRDDTTSGGPENIFWPTGKGPPGTYTYYALYYAGSGPKEATLEVRKRGKVVETRTVVLRTVREESIYYTYKH